MKKSELNLDLGAIFMELSAEWFRSKYPLGLEIGSRRNLYSAAYTTYLIIQQKAHGMASLSAITKEQVDLIEQPEIVELVKDSKRYHNEQISQDASGLCRARKRLSLEKVIELSDHVSSKIESEWKSEQLYGYRPYVLDGSNFQLANTAAIRAEFPPSANQTGELPPQALMVLAHNIITGTAVRPEIGGLYDSEQGLCVPVLKRLPAKSLIVGDSNFGIFSVAYNAKQNKVACLVRLQESRANKILGKKKVCEDCDRKVIWEASSYDLAATPTLPEEAKVQGRVIAITPYAPGQRAKRLFFFTTTALTVEQILDIYRRRWFIETDLRSMKQTLKLDRLYSKTPELVRKELLAGFLAYTMIRTVIMRGAKVLEVDPRRFSFASAAKYISCSAASLRREKTLVMQEHSYQQFFVHLGQCKLPQRTQTRLHPRAVVVQKKRFPTLKGSRKDAQLNIIKDLDK